MKCDNCTQDFNDIKKYVFHLEYVHNITNYFKCTIQDCGRLFHRKDRFKSHIKLKHEHEVVLCKPQCNIQESKLNESNDVANVSFPDINNLDESEVSTNKINNLNSKLYLEKFKTILGTSIESFISKFYDIPEISRTVVQLIIDSVSNFLSSGFINIIKERIQSLFNMPKIDLKNELENILQMLDMLTSPFFHLNTEYKRFKYFENKETFLKPIPHILGVTHDRKQRSGCVTLELKNAYAYNISMRKTLKLFFELPNVFSAIIEYQKSLEAYARESMCNVIHGELWHKLKSKFASNDIVFPLIMYFDDFETLNPLGSHAGCYKIGNLYYTVATIPPIYASRLENIFLSTIFYSNDRLKFGNRKIFEPVINELKFLESEGINIKVAGNNYNIKFCLILLCGDNLGLHSILGLNESFSSNYYCRFCTEKKDTMKHQTHEIANSIRNKNDYHNHVLNNIGIKEICVWNDLPSFHIYENITCDIMHDIYEGILRYDMSLIIKELLDKKYFTLANLNSRIKYFHYEPDEKNIPPAINNDHLSKGSIIMSSAEMLCLCRNFRFIVGDLVPEHNEIWHFYLLILELVNILSSQTMARKSLDLLTNLIQEHNELYLKFSKGSLKPKFHWFLHYPRIIQKVGPPKLISCLRFEAKHKEYKNVAQSIRCRKNLPFSLATKIQLKTCHRFNGLKGFYDNICMGLLSDVDIKYSANFDEQDINIMEFFKSNWYEINGIKYDHNSVLLFEALEDIPTFFSIKDIYIKQNDSKIVYFFGLILKTIDYSEHYRAYKIEKTTQFKLIALKDFFSNIPTIIRTVKHSLYVNIKDK